MNLSLLAEEDYLYNNSLWNWLKPCHRSPSLQRVNSIAIAYIKFSFTPCNEALFKYSRQGIIRKWIRVDKYKICCIRIRWNFGSIEIKVTSFQRKWQISYSNYIWLFRRRIQTCNFGEISIALLVLFEEPQDSHFGLYLRTNIFMLQNYCMVF